jgi:HEPN domain-containing protein
MEKEDFVKYWVKSSEHDLNVAESLFSSEHFDYCLFIAHLSLEKLLKAFWVIANPENIPPKTHNLIYLAKQTNLAA